MSAQAHDFPFASEEMPAAMAAPKAPVVRFPRVGRQELGELAKKFETLLEKAREAALEPARKKVLRKWNATEVAELLGMTDDSLRRRLKKDATDRADPTKADLFKDEPPLPQGEMVNGGRRNFTLEEIHALQKALTPPKRDPARDKSLVVSVCNFKGGVAKTTSALHLSQYLVLHGYRVLLIDLDAQSTLTQQFGILPHIDVKESQTALPYFEGPELAAKDGVKWEPSLRPAISKTYWHNLDLICANLAFYGADFALAARAARDETFQFYRILAEGLETVKDDYDVVILDTAPSLSFVNANAIFGVNAFLVTMPPAMMELQSGGLFFRWLEELAKVFAQVEDQPKFYDFCALLITKMKHLKKEPGEASKTRGKGKATEAKTADRALSSQEEIRSWMKAYFPMYLVEKPMVESSVLQKISQGLETLYEVTNYESDRRTFNRALQAMNDVNAEIESAIQMAWQRRREERAAVESPAHAAEAS